MGDIISWPYDIDGKLINHPVTERIMAVPLSEIRKIKKRIAIASGVEKIPAILGAARGGYINELITDEKTADEMIRFLSCIPIQGPKNAMAQPPI